MIGIFDSGSGGLSVLKALRGIMPSADVVYFGDIKHAPYGLKTQEELSLLTTAAIEHLEREGAHHIVSACNSVAASLVISLSDRLAFASDMIEMVGPTVASFRETQKKLALCATPATINSGIYQSAFELIGQDVQCIAIPDLAFAIESGASDAELQQIVQAAFADREGFDTLVLACTHYPLVRSIFEQALPHVEIFDPAMVVAERARDAFPEEHTGAGTTRFIISKDSPRFRAFVQMFFGDTPHTIEVREG
jgi:glutamate racemase